MTNAYDYPADPINRLDLSGERVQDHPPRGHSGGGRRYTTLLNDGLGHTTIVTLGASRLTHILVEHMNSKQWLKMAELQTNNPEPAIVLMDQMIAMTLADPDTMDPQPANSTWKYTKQVELWETGTWQFPRLVGTATIVVIWGTPDYNVITAYPTKIKAVS